jgi:ABC-type transport system substrate-binding protein
VNDPLLSNKDFRKALQHLVDFKELNGKLMYDAYFRQVSNFYGTPFANPNLKSYEFNPRTARELLTKAGFTAKASDGTLVREDGTRASFTLTFGSKGLEPHLTTIQSTFKRMGVDMKLQLLEPATAFNRGMEKTFQALVFNRTANFYPDPHQYFSCETSKEMQTNNNWGYCNEEVDKLIEVYRFDKDPEKRIAAAHRIDEIVHDDAITIPFWTGPYMRFVYWDYLEFPDFYFPKSTEQHSDFQVFWINPEKQAKLEAAMKAGTSLGEDTVVDVDPYDIKGRLEASARGAEGK